MQQHFETICQRRLKDIVSKVRTNREQPIWIESELWKVMVAEWDTEEAKARSEIYSAARLSDRDGLGPHIHLSGPKSYQQIQHELVSNFKYLLFVFVILLKL